MKILRLDLRAFGPFTNQAIDLSGGMEGLHVIYGPNEAGKTTTLRAIEQALFGIAPRSTDDFLHSYQNLRIGATLKNNSGTTLSFVRRKGNTNTLLAEDGLTPLDDAVLQPFLGNVDRNLFLTMFGIDHDRMVQGGREIVQGSGNVGQVLFAAGAGIAHLQQVQQRLDEEVQNLFAPRAQKPPINKCLQELKEARAKLKQSQLPSNEWTKHDEQLRQARSERTQIEQNLAEHQRDRSRLERLAEALPIIAQYRQRLLERQNLGVVILLRTDFAEERRRAAAQLEAAQNTAQSCDKELQRIDGQLEQIHLPDTLLVRAAEIRNLSDPLGSHRKAQHDVPILQSHHQKLLEEAAAILRDCRPDITLDAIDGVRLTTVQKNTIGDLGGRYEALTQRCRDAHEALADAQQRLEEEQQQRDSAEAEHDPAKLKMAIQRAQSQGDLDQSLSKARSELQRLEQQVAADLKRLPLRSGDLADVESLAVPPTETIDRYERELAEADQPLAAEKEKIEAAQLALAENQRQLDQSKLEGEVPTEQNLLKARQIRDQGWQLVRQAWQESKPDISQQAEFLSHFSADLDLAAAYTQAVQDADHWADRLRREADRVATQANLLASRESLDRQLVLAQDRHAAAAARQAEVCAAWADCWKAADIQPLMPREMRAWLEQQRSLVKQAANIRSQQAQVQQLQEQIVSCSQELRQQLAALSESLDAETETLSAVVSHSQAVVERIESAMAARMLAEKTVRLITQDLAKIQKNSERADEDWADWQHRWVLAIEPLGLVPESTPAQAQQMLAQLTAVFERLKEAQGIHERMEDIRRDADAFAQDVKALADPINPDLLVLPTDAAAQALLQWLQKAQQDQGRVLDYQQQRQQWAADAQKARTAVVQHSATLKTLCCEAGCDLPEKLPEAERTSDAAARLDERIAQLNNQLLRLSVGTPLEVFIAEADTVVADELPGRLEQLSQRITELESRRKELSETIGAEENSLRSMQTGSEAADTAETIETLLARLEVDTQQYVRLRLASAVLRGGIERYRRKHEGPVLRRASELFRDLTLGRFDRLNADCDDRGQNLLQGVRAGDSAVAVDVAGMSEGTADQLYLALRLASLENYLEDRNPVPLIVDDVLISFDDQRAAAALSILGNFSLRTQVIFFTHHTRLVELARQSVPADRLFVHKMA